MSTKPGVSLHDVQFEEQPHIVRRGEHFFLHYRLAPTAGDQTAMRMVVGTKNEKDKGYYFFIAPVSQPERGNVVERPLASDGMTEVARRGAVYWLNPDGSEILLEIR